jgi:hypothetical protein
MWRYSIQPNHVRLFSLVSDLRWHPHQFVEVDVASMDGDRGILSDGKGGIHGFKTEGDLFKYSTDSSLARATGSGCDGVVFGTIAMWGVVWEHEYGYRAQFARPTSFVSAYGNRSEQALAELRAWVTP